jgi:hypothetical protein
MTSSIDAVATRNRRLRGDSAAVLDREPARSDAEQSRTIDFVSTVLPCLNEEEGVGATVAEAFHGLERTGLPGEVIVVDNGSTDRSVERAQAAGARVISEARRGYGAAHLAGIRAARGNVVVMADADQTYDLERMGDLLTPLTEGADIVVGSRLLGGIEREAMPFLHRYVGTPIITRVLCLLTGVGLSDSQSGYRAFWRDAVLSLELRASGMEYASEMLLRAGRARLTVQDVPSAYRARVGESKLNTLADGWRHILMLLLLSPHLALLLPGAVCVLLGAVLSCVSIFAPTGIMLGSLHWLPVFLGPTLLIIGAQALLLGGLAAYRSSLTPASIRRRLRFLGRPGAVTELIAGSGLFVLAGLLIDSCLLALWLAGKSGPALLGAAGIAQALIIIGACGVFSVMAAEYSKDHLGW